MIIFGPPIAVEYEDDNNNYDNSELFEDPLDAGSLMLETGLVLIPTDDRYD